MSLEWILLGFRILAAVILYTFLGLAFYIIWRDLKGAAAKQNDQSAPTHLLRVVGSPAEYWTAVRLLPGGQIDSTFGGGGWVLADFACPDWMTCANPSPDSRVSGLALEDDGRILIAGSSSTLTGDVRGFAVARLLPSGLVDPTFGGGGQLVVDLPYGVGVGRDEAWGLALSPSGHIALAGTTEWNGADTDVAFLLLSNGLLFADGFESGDFSGW